VPLHVSDKFKGRSAQGLYGDVIEEIDWSVGQILGALKKHRLDKNTLVIFTADHGVSPVPEHAARMSLPGRRNQKADLRGIVEAGLIARYARPDRPATDYIQIFTNKEAVEQGLINGNFYLNRAALQRDGIDLDDCERVVGESAMAMPGVARYFTRAQLERASISPGDPVARRILNGFYPQRSGDVIVVFEPYDILFDLPDDPADERSSATHGSPYSYDTHVPLIIMGRDFVKGSYPQEATPADIAPTLAGLLRVQAPSCSAGRVLFEALVNNKETRGFVR